ncbi:MAG: Ig-like domain-containing protein [Paracoccaceae bacterium]
MGNYGIRIIEGRSGEYDEAGLSVTGIGDFNGDGLDDVAVSTRFGESDVYGDTNETGTVYVVFGTSEPDAQFNLEDIDGTNGFQIFADPSISDYNFYTTFGHKVVGLGDVDGDGTDDFGIVQNGTTYSTYGGYSEYGNSRIENQGIAYVIYGGQDTNGEDGLSVGDMAHFRMDTYAGIDTMIAMGDVNGDGFADVGLSTRDASGYETLNISRLYDANENGYYDRDNETNPNEYYTSYSRDIQVIDTTGYIVFGTDQERVTDDEIADRGGSEIILNLETMSDGDGLTLNLGQEIGGRFFGYYGEFGPSLSARSVAIDINNTYSYNQAEIGLLEGADINGDGFADFITTEGIVDVDGIYTIRTPDGNETVSGYGASNGFFLPEITDGSDGSTTTLNVNNMSQGPNSIAGLGDFSGGEGLDELGVIANSIAITASAEPRSGVFVLNGASNILTLDEITVNMGTVNSGIGSFYYSSDLYFDGQADRLVVQNYIGVTSAGDMNGDGTDDMLLLARGVNGELGNHVMAYIVFGSDSVVTGAVDLELLIASGDAYKILGDANDSLGRTSLSAAGDPNGDGAGDIILGQPDNQSGNGDAAIIHGGDALAAADAADGTADGIIQNDNLAVDVDTGLVPIFVEINTDLIIVQEGDTGSTDAIFTIERNGDLNAAVSVDFSVIAGGASFNSDADASDFEGGVLPSGTVTFASGEKFAQLEVPIAGDLTAEVREDFTVQLSNPVTDNGASISVGDDLGRGLIETSDQPVQFSTFTRSITEGDPGDNVVALMSISRSGNTQVEASVDWQLVENTNQSDFNADSDDVEGTLPLSGTATFTAGQTFMSIEIPIAEDLDVENTESLTFLLSNATAPNGIVSTITTSSAQLRIFNDDNPVTFSVNDVTVTEGDTGPVDMIFTVTRSGIVDAAASVDFTFAFGSASAEDFDSGFIDTATGLPRTGTLSFAAGETAKTITVQAAGDLLDEFTESFSVSLSNATTDDVNGAQIFDGFGIGRIVDNDQSVEFRAFDAQVTEGDAGDQTTITFTVTRASVTDVRATVDYSLDPFPGTTAAVDSNDFVSGFPQTGTLVFEAGETSKTVSAVVSGDFEVESREFMQLNLSNASADGGENTTIVTGNATGTILNDDQAVTITAQFPTVFEGDSGTTDMIVNVFRSGNLDVAANVDYVVRPAVSSQAADNADIVGSFNLTGTVSFAAGETLQTIIIPVQGDTVVEPNEFVEVLFSNATAEGGAQTSLITTQVTGTIVNDDLPVTFQVLNSFATEGANGALTPLTFTVTRSGELDVEASVDFELSDYRFGAQFSAESNDFDGGFPSAGTLTFAAGEVAKTVTLQIRDDAVVEGNELVDFELSNPQAPGYDAGALLNNSSLASGTIIDNDFPVRVSVNSAVVTELDPGQSVTLDFVITRSGNTAVDTDVDYAIAPYAFRGADDGDLNEPPLPILGTVSFAAGETTKTVSVNVAGDNLVEGTEYLTLDLTDASSSDPAADVTFLNTRAFGTIIDDDQPTVFAVRGISTVEGDTGTANTLSFIVSRSGDVSAAASVDYDISGGLVDADDFASGAFPTSGTLNFAAGITTVRIDLPVQGDEDIERSEYTYATLSSPSSSNSGIPAQISAGSAFATIVNDDFPAQLSVSYWNSTTEGDTAADGTELSFLITRTGDSSSSVSVDYDFEGDSFTPLDGADFEGGLPQSGTVTFGVGETQKLISFQIAEDTDIENNERGRLTLSNEQLLSGQPGATVDIIRDVGYGIVNNDDTPPKVEVFVNGRQWGTSITEGNGGNQAVNFTIVRDGPLTDTLTVNYDLFSDVATGRGASSFDIVGNLPDIGNILTFTPGQSSKTVTVLVTGDTMIEANEVFGLNIAALSSNQDVDYDLINTITTVTIRNDDGRPPIPELGIDDDGDGIPDRFIRVEADVFGDPHITTLDGLGYDFQAVGEYVLVETTDGAENPFSVQVRFEAFPGSDLVSVTTRAAVEVKGKTVEFDALDPDAPLLVDGVAIDMEQAAQTGVDLDDDPDNGADIFIDEDGKIFLTLNEAGEVLMVGVMDGSLNVCVFLADSAGGGNAGAVRGLMGNANQDLTDDFQMRDGSDIPEDAISFDDDGVPALTFNFIYGFGEYEGEGYKGSWQIDTAEALFSGDTPDFPANFPAAPLKLEDLPDDVRQAAEDAAREAGLSPEDNKTIFEAAVLDFALTGNEDFVVGATQLAAEPEEASQTTENPDTPPTVSISADAQSIIEGDDDVQEVSFTVYRSETNGALEVDYQIGGDIDADDLATDTPLTGTVGFEDGQSEAVITILVKGDVTTEGDEGLQVTLVGDNNDGVLIGGSRGETIIETDDFAPEAQDDAFTADAGDLISGNLFDDNGQDEDSDPDDDNLNLVNILIGDAVFTPADSPVDLPDGGSLSFDADGNFQFDPGTDFDSLPDGDIETVSFGYQMGDGNGGFASADVILTINGTFVPAENSAPIAVDDDFMVNEDTATTLNFLENDSDPNGDTLLTSILTEPTNGTLALLDGIYTYTPETNFSGTDSFTYQISDGEFSDTATVNLTVEGMNDAPTLSDATTGGTEDTPVSLSLAINAFDLDGDDLTFTLVSDPNSGQAQISTDGDLSYTPDDDFNGSDSLTYQVSDGKGGTATATLTFDIAAVNDAPDAVDDTTSTDEDSAVTGNLISGAGNLSADSDVDGDTLTVIEARDSNGALLSLTAAMALPEGGQLSIAQDGAFLFDPMTAFQNLAAGQSRDVSFTYVVSDGDLTDTASVSITVNGVNDAPLFGDIPDFSIAENTTAVGSVSATDVDDDALTYSLIGGDDEALFAIDADSGAISFKAAADFETPLDVGGDNRYEIQVQVSDGTETSEEFVFVDVTDVVEVITPVINVEQGSDLGYEILTGTDGQDEIRSGGGAFDQATGGGGADVFVFEGGAGRQTMTITDYEIGIDAIDLSGQSVFYNFSAAGTTYLYLDGGDFDTLTVIGASSFDDITFVEDNTLLG